jgi:hypothetical protein
MHIIFKSFFAFIPNTHRNLQGMREEAIAFYKSLFAAFDKLDQVPSITTRRLKSNLYKSNNAIYRNHTSASFPLIVVTLFYVSSTWHFYFSEKYFHS